MVYIRKKKGLRLWISKVKEISWTDIFGMMFKSGIQRTLTKQTFRGALIEVYLSKYSNLSTEFSTNNTTNKYLNNLKLIFFKL